MNHPVLVGIVETSAHLNRQVEFLLEGDEHLLFEEGLQILAFQILHGDEGSVPILAHVVDGYNVRVPNFGR
jgi:hypothetical protein